MKLFTIEDQNNLSEARREAEQRVLKLAEILISDRVNEAVGFDVGEQLMAEAHKLEKLTIVEALSDQDFSTLQKNFRSLLRPIGSLVKNLAGTDLAKKLEVARAQGLELMNSMVGDIQNADDDVSMDKTGVPRSKELSQSRDKLAKVFADVAILTKGAMALGDLFSDDPASMGGYTAMKEIVSSLEQDDLLSVPLHQAFARYQEAVDANSLSTHHEKEAGKDDAKDHDWFSQGDNMDWVSDTPGGERSAAHGDKNARPKHLPKKQGIFSRLFGKKHESLDYLREYDTEKDPFAGTEEAPTTKRGGFAAAKPGPLATEKDPFAAKAKQSNLERKFRQLLQKTMVEKSPGFARMVDVPKLIEDLVSKSYDHLAGIFGRFNDLVSNDVDMNFLQQVVNKPLSVGGALKTVWDAFSSGTMGGVRGRPR